jgi:hypothetical protein
VVRQIKESPHGITPVTVYGGSEVDRLRQQHLHSVEKKRVRLTRRRKPDTWLSLINGERGYLVRCGRIKLIGRLVDAEATNFLIGR